MYPTMVVVLVESQRSMTDVCGVNQSNAAQAVELGPSEARAATLGHPISFAVGPNQYTMNREYITTVPLQSRYSGGPKHGVIDIAEKESHSAR